MLYSEREKFPHGGGGYLCARAGFMDEEQA